MGKVMVSKATTGKHKRRLPLNRRIGRLRAALGVTQVQFATLIQQGMRDSGGPHPSTVARWERGDSVPSGEYLEALARVAKRAGLDDLFE